MSCPTRKKTLAQLRAEKRKREVDYVEGWELAVEVERMFSQSSGRDDRYDLFKGLLVKAQRACDLLLDDPEAGHFRFSLVVKSKILLMVVVSAVFVAGTMIKTLVLDHGIPYIFPLGAKTPPYHIPDTPVIVVVSAVLVTGSMIRTELLDRGKQ